MYIYSATLLRNHLNKGHSTSDISIKEEFCDPYRTITIPFYIPLKEDNLDIYLYNSKIIPKLASPICPIF